MQNVPLTATKLHFSHHLLGGIPVLCKITCPVLSNNILQSNLALQNLKAHQRFIRLKGQPFCQISFIPGEQTAHIAAKSK